MGMTDEFEVFLAKVDAFAQGLSTTERAMLAELVGDEADVTGFGSRAWPTNWTVELAPTKVANLRRGYDSFQLGDTSNWPVIDSSGLGE